MKTLLNKTILALLGTSILTSVSFAEEIQPSYAQIKSKITQNERALMLKKRDNLAQNIANREHLYLSNIMDKTREENRIQR